MSRAKKKQTSKTINPAKPDRLRKTMASKRPYSQDFSGVSITDQSFAPSCDVNNIVRHYEKTGIAPGNKTPMQPYGSAASTTSYEAAMRAKAEIDSAFELLPVSERLLYDNDAQLWFDGITEPEPLTEAPAASETPPAEPLPEAPTEVGND